MKRLRVRKAKEKGREVLFLVQNDSKHFERVHGENIQIKSDLIHAI